MPGCSCVPHNGQCDSLCAGFVDLLHLIQWEGPVGWAANITNSPARAMYVSRFIAARMAVVFACFVGLCCYINNYPLMLSNGLTVDFVHAVRTGQTDGQENARLRWTRGNEGDRVARLRTTGSQFSSITRSIDFRLIPISGVTRETATEPSEAKVASGRTKQIWRRMEVVGACRCGRGLVTTPCLIAAGSRLGIRPPAATRPATCVRVSAHRRNSASRQTCTETWRLFPPRMLLATACTDENSFRSAFLLLLLCNCSQIRRHSVNRRRL